MYHPSSSVLATNKTPNGTEKHHKNTQPTAVFLRSQPHCNPSAQPQYSWCACAFHLGMRQKNRCIALCCQWNKTLEKVPIINLNERMNE